MGADSSFLESVYRVGQVVFQGQGWGWVRSVYFALLLILAIVIVPLILIKLRSAWLEKVDKHRLIARWTLRRWFHVCITAMIIYLMVYQIQEE
jgi:uncharacterized membrane protein YozB (DUF420 family)